MRILIIDDDENISAVLQRQFETHGFAVDLAQDGKQGSFMARVEKYDLIILDNVMPEKSGVEVCKELRHAGIETPILMLSVQSDVDDKAHLLNLGVDDYVTKPFFFREVLARAKALLRRPAKIISSKIKAQDITLDTLNGVASRGENILNLTQKEISILEYLLRHKNMVISRATLLDHVWGNGVGQFSKTIEAHMVNLRKKMEAYGPPIIRTISGRGYIIDDKNKD